LASVDLDQLTPTIEPMVMNTERGRTWTALFNAEVEEMTDTNSPAAATVVAPESVPPVATGSTAPVEEEPMDVVEEKTEEAASAPVSAQPARLSRLEKLRQDVRQKESSQVKPPEPVIDVVMGSQSWHNEVPRVRIFRNRFSFHPNF
jgi:uncharacterized protein YcbK (DUF882 family)